MVVMPRSLGVSKCIKSSRMMLGEPKTRGLSSTEGRVRSGVLGLYLFPCHLSCCLGVHLFSFVGPVVNPGLLTTYHAAIIFWLEFLARSMPQIFWGHMFTRNGVSLNLAYVFSLIYGPVS